MLAGAEADAAPFAMCHMTHQAVQQAAAMPHFAAAAAAANVQLPLPTPQPLKPQTRAVLRACCVAACPPTCLRPRGVQGLPGAEAHLTVVSGDVTDAAGLQAAMSCCEQLVHLAAVVDVSPPRDEAHKQQMVDTALHGTRTVLGAWGWRRAPSGRGGMKASSSSTSKSDFADGAQPSIHQSC